MTDVGTFLVSLKATTSMLRGLLVVGREFDKVELKGKLVDVVDLLTEAQTRISAQEERIRELEAKLALRAVMDYRAPAYWQKRDGKPDDGPFCATCWDSGEKVIRLQPLHSGGMVCYTCTNVFGIPERQRPNRATTDFSPFDY